MVQLLGLVIYYVINVYVFILILRVVLDWVQILARGWRPRGIILVLANLIYALTDPPVRFFGRLIPPLRIGGLALDMGFMVLFILLFVVQRVAVSIVFMV
ncbi:YggT family protein [Mobiluncus curtisii]|uniref:YggT family protein n=1 Tax=Mobiluncus curtisii TaxID=2051 RepID=UPI00147084F0|nr:YggT family protein [Mobiluncus curtisii]MCV0020913.1 YggT family protein [Mobiluncus curtisii]NMW48170.1 YggT family protein [Mobiluncus curtisii]NMW83354.1 YggT family protein [Mobiluncus curtisii]